MAIKDIVFYPNPVLRKKCEKVKEYGSELTQLLDDLAESMYSHKGVGLASPQIGVIEQVAVVDVNQCEGVPRLIELVNPEITQTSNKQITMQEGCLSFPNEIEIVKRPDQVTVKAFNRHGKAFEITSASGLLSRALQHEIDHLNGVLFIDHLSLLKRSLIDHRMKKRAKNT